ncbi:MAG: SDR family NAD(P)-dependent oxidoreductase [Thermoleophilia bacterium]|jgi:NAD(P)-dependent dehydrogenase (short-subunit alcohol dehydrogenase family)
MTGPLAGRRALVTGAAVRVGRALALCCAGAGMDVVVHYRSSPEQAEATAADCRALGVRAQTVAGDLAETGDCRRVVREAVDALGGLDALVASASTFEPRAFADIDDDHIDRTIAVNLRAPLIMAQEAAPHLRLCGHGRIVLMNDVAGLEPWPRFLVHSVSKAGVGMLTLALAQELAPEITVNAIAPGTVLMPDGHTDAAAERSAQKAVLQRLGSPDDVAGAMRYLLEADYVTGHTLVVDGGRLVRP